jgi:hypothetical protein
MCVSLHFTSLLLQFASSMVLVTSTRTPPVCCSPACVPQCAQKYGSISLWPSPSPPVHTSATLLQPPHLSQLSTNKTDIPLPLSHALSLSLSLSLSIFLVDALLVFSGLVRVYHIGWRRRVMEEVPLEEQVQLSPPPPPWMRWTLPAASARVLFIVSSKGTAAEPDRLFGAVCTTLTRIFQHSRVMPTILFKYPPTTHELAKSMIGAQQWDVIHIVAHTSNGTPHFPTAEQLLIANTYHVEWVGAAASSAAAAACVLVL